MTAKIHLSDGAQSLHQQVMSQNKKGTSTQQPTQQAGRPAWSNPGTECRTWSAIRPSWKPCGRNVRGRLPAIRNVEARDSALFMTGLHHPVSVMRSSPLPVQSSPEWPLAGIWVTAATSMPQTKGAPLHNWVGQHDGPRWLADASQSEQPSTAMVASLPVAVVEAAPYEGTVPVLAWFQSPTGTLAASSTGMEPSRFQRPLYRRLPIHVCAQRPTHRSAQHGSPGPRRGCRIVPLNEP